MSRYVPKWNVRVRETVSRTRQRDRISSLEWLLLLLYLHLSDELRRHWMMLVVVGGRIEGRLDGNVDILVRDEDFQILIDWDLVGRRQACALKIRDPVLKQPLYA